MMMVCQTMKRFALVLLSLEFPPITIWCSYLNHTTPMKPFTANQYLQQSNWLYRDEKSQDTKKNISNFNF